MAVASCSLPSLLAPAGVPPCGCVHLGAGRHFVGGFVACGVFWEHAANQMAHDICVHKSGAQE